MINPLRPVLLVILDGWGVAAASQGNSITRARKPNLDAYFASFPNTVLEAAGEAVGLPPGEAGNSEVGHTNLGAGRIVYQDLPRINMAIADGSFLTNPVFLEAFAHARGVGSAVHLMGLVGSGGVHSSIEHLYALLWLAKKQNLEKVYLHLFTDGRDSPPYSSTQLFAELESKLDELGVGKIATISGRYFAMDRDQRWERTQKAYDAMVKGVGARAESALQAIEISYQRKITDEFIEPTVISSTGEVTTIKDNDSVIFFNFRPDRARQLTKSFVLDQFQGFPRERKLENLYFVSITLFEKGLPTHVAFPAPQIDYPLASVVSSKNLRQLHIGETEKYAHITYFFNAGLEAAYPGEDRIHIPSPRVATYDTKPEMSSNEITEQVSERLKVGQYDFYVINFASADMVAHTGSLDATIKAVEILDGCVGKVVGEAMALGGATVLVGDHGNAEQMINPSTGEPDTEHTANSVPFLAVAGSLKDFPNPKLQSGVLADVAPTILTLMGIVPPEVMTGRNLLV